GLVRSIYVQHAAVEHGVAGYDPQRVPGDASQAGDDVAREARLDREKLAVVDEGGDHPVHVESLARILRDDLEQLFISAVDRVCAVAARRPLLAVRRKKRKVVAYCGQTRSVVGIFGVRSSGDLGMDPRAPQLLLGDFLPYYGLHQVRA